jgi:hypothetical protein
MKNIAGLRPDQRALLRRYVLTYPRVESDLTVLAQKRLDKFAQEKGYDNISFYETDIWTILIGNLEN